TKLWAPEAPPPWPPAWPPVQLAAGAWAGRAAGAARRTAGRLSISAASAGVTKVKLVSAASAASAMPATSNFFTTLPPTLRVQDATHPYPDLAPNLYSGRLSNQ